MSKTIILDDKSVHCSQCMSNHLCMPAGLNAQETEKLTELVKERIRIPKNQVLFQAGDSFSAIYSVRSGSLKTQLESENGHIQITGFSLPGELIGFDGIATQTHSSTAMAMEDSEVCVIRLDDLDRLAQSIPALNSQLRQLMGNEINRSHHMALPLGSLKSDQRVAAFILNMVDRLARLGYSSSEFILRMTREEIGVYLGLTLETVSRLLSRFAREGLITVEQKEIRVLDRAGLQALIKKENH
ncbi:fumarate/nitrate reduction transcriptional regulator Fnr [Oligella sp. HMSC09E12]|uniref:fumarate/nitrate reduction transcriptional regulator Fnr n=1 Tax=Oligella sp. HMSC09E12 TaxID=1581147 RepID=UPI0008A40F76|nr:fumarate/nitrate reduction transcriptional regulator Fnr [Oligella sp. HMSC09E12]OFV48876.1 transcriptional regulator [Oligella sp. HMSC09E12]